MTKKLSDKTLREAALNPDGKTYNGVSALRWLAEVIHNTSISEEEGRELLLLAQQKARARVEAKFEKDKGK